MIIYLGDDIHRNKADTRDARLTKHKISRIAVIKLRLIGARAVNHDQSEYRQENDGKQQTVIIKPMWFFLFIFSRFRHTSTPLLFVVTVSKFCL